MVEVTKFVHASEDSITEFVAQKILNKINNYDRILFDLVKEFLKDNGVGLTTAGAYTICSLYFGSINASSWGDLASFFNSDKYKEFHNLDFLMNIIESNPDKFYVREKQ